MISNTAAWYVFIRACILFLHWITPLSIIYCAIALFIRPSGYLVLLPLEIWAVAETLFYGLVYLPRKWKLQQSTVHPPPLSKAQRHELFQRCHENVKDPEGYLSKWFLGAPKHEIKRENVKEFLCWAFLDKEAWSEADEEELEGYADDMESQLGRKLEPGRGRAKALRLTLDKVAMLHRSLLWYLCVSVVDTITFVCMLRYSFHFHRRPHSKMFHVFPFRPLAVFSTYHSPAKTLTYWHRPHASKTRLPVLFIHGIGIGLYPYVNFLVELNHQLDTDIAQDDVGIIAIEIMPVSFRITDPALEKDEMCNEILEILNKHRWDKCVLVSHSYGTVISTHLLHNKKTSPRFGPVLLIDPVSFLLHLPDVAYNFTARKPKRANEYQLWYFASMDMGVAHTLGRRFFWAENILWKQDIQGRSVTASLAGQDLIVNTEAVGRYLKEGEKVNDEVDWKRREWKGDRLDVLWFDELDHAQIFDSKRHRKMLICIIRTYCAQVDT